MSYLFIGLAISFGILFFRIGRQLFSTYRCIDRSTLRDFHYGKLQKHSNDHRRVITHLGHCEKCREMLHQISRGRPLEDHLVE